MGTETMNKELHSEAVSAAHVIKSHKRIDPRVVDQQLKGMAWRYKLPHRDAARLIAEELEKLDDVDKALIAEFKRIYVGGN